MGNNEKDLKSAQNFSDGQIKKMFDGQDKALIRLFIDTLSFALRRITAMTGQKDFAAAKVKIMMELDKIYQSSKYLGIEDVAGLVEALKDKMSSNADLKAENTAALQKILQPDLSILQKITAYWHDPADSPAARRINEERKILKQFSREDDELQQLFIALLQGYMEDIYNNIVKMKNGQIPQDGHKKLSDLLLRLDTSVNFMDYPELSELIREGLVAVKEDEDKNTDSWLNGIITIYNKLVDNMRVQFSGSEGIQESCRKIE